MLERNPESAVAWEMLAPRMWGSDTDRLHSELRRLGSWGARVVMGAAPAFPVLPLEGILVERTRQVTGPSSHRKGTPPRLALSSPGERLLT